MTVRHSGRVTVDVVYDRKARLSNRVAGAHRARIVSQETVIDELLVLAPMHMRDDPTSVLAIDTVAKIALYYSLGDHPTLDVERHADTGALLFQERKRVPVRASRREPA